MRNPQHKHVLTKFQLRCLGLGLEFMGEFFSCLFNGTLISMESTGTINERAISYHTILMFVSHIFRSLRCCFDITSVTRSLVSLHSAIIFLFSQFPESFNIASHSILLMPFIYSLSVILFTCYKILSYMSRIRHILLLNYLGSFYFTASCIHIFSLRSNSSEKDHDLIQSYQLS